MKRPQTRSPNKPSPERSGLVEVSPPAPRQPTMTDVARLAGVSQSSVSLVLNNMTGARIAEGTRERVLKIAAEIGYALPNQRRTAQSDTIRDTIAFVIDEISTSPHPVANLDGVRDQAWESSFLVATHVTRSNTELERATLAAIRRDTRVLGVVYATIFTREIEQVPDFGDVPVVLLNCYSKTQRRDGHRHLCIVPAEVSGGFAATEFLIAQGHRRIGFINGEAWMDAATDRLKGYRRALATHDIPFDPQLVLNGDWLPLSGEACAEQLLSMTNPPSVIFCANDLMAMGAITAARNLGLHVPGDISIMGYDDQELARYTHPPLTTLVLPNYEMGRHAAEVLIASAVSATRMRPGIVKIEGPLVERSSVAALSTDRNNAGTREVVRR
jgi:LacI family transcriptional regulator